LTVSIIKYKIHAEIWDQYLVIRPSWNIQFWTFFK